MKEPPLHRRDLIRAAALAATALALRAPLAACSGGGPSGDRLRGGPDQERLARWSESLRAERLVPPETQLGRAATRVGELAAGTPYEARTLEAYLRERGDPEAEPLTLSLTRFDCVTLVEACLAVARASVSGPASWEAFGHEVERMRYRGGMRSGYASRLHYFSEWLADGERRGLVEDLGRKLGGVEDPRPLRFMTSRRDSYPALVDDAVFSRIAEIERGLDGHPRYVVPTSRIPNVAEGIETGDALAFATTIPGLDVTHAAFAYHDDTRTLRVLHAPLSGGVVEITSSTLPEYVAGIRRSSGILVARPKWAPLSR